MIFVLSDITILHVLRIIFRVSDCVKTVSVIQHSIMTFVGNYLNIIFVKLLNTLNAVKMLMIVRYSRLTLASCVSFLRESLHGLWP